jgi:hypothetical protein
MERLDKKKIAMIILALGIGLSLLILVIAAYVTSSQRECPNGQFWHEGGCADCPRGWVCN